MCERFGACANLFNQGRSVAVQAWATELKDDTYAFYPECQRLAQELSEVDRRSIVLQESMDFIEVEEGVSDVSTYKSDYLLAPAFRHKRDSGVSSRRASDARKTSSSGDQHIPALQVVEDESTGAGLCDAAKKGTTALKVAIQKAQDDADENREETEYRHILKAICMGVLILKLISSEYQEYFCRGCFRY
ncbi:hypothetical protein SARC_05028 [Sphaeroforma arctica JP610]|uniref:Uncharacterized protein n=1 Tax=Sphaeroforma arctica JP610 TaxID=667725 RepID=A0A0L0G1I2_9EUKA|nr:hypothetical protein SARC_05028 [Sphaeroforma arctica JP610]KNC82689.1 hypothetical protein SARC_05028 [Sphaeroforma arctica JP610]|eukprot:XP_014156591.1 hypothetical protein SARC_05028 [Sphaeroforma arctica JP610]